MKYNASIGSKLLACSLMLGLLGCSNHPEKLSFTLKNDSHIARTDEPVTLSRQDISDKSGELSKGKSPVLVDAKGDTIPSQLDDLNQDGAWDQLAFLANVPADSSTTISLRFVDAHNYPQFTIRTNIRFGVKDSTGITNRKKMTFTRNQLPVAMYSTFQMDGPAWENDKVGFRHYMDGRNERDLFGKTSSKMALDTMGISPKGDLVDNYHVMRYWGRDILSVGNSLGIGGLAMLNHGKAVRLGVRANAPTNNIDTTKYQLITQGPVRSIYKLSYKGWQVGDKKYDIDNEISIWGGHYWYASKVTLHSLHQKTDSLMVGLVNSNNDKLLMVLDSTATDWIALATHDKQTYNKKWYLGLGLILPKQNYIKYKEAPQTGKGITTSYNALVKMHDGESIKYYTLAGWEISDKKFADRAYFKKFMQQAISEIQHPVRIQ